MSEDTPIRFCKDCANYKQVRTGRWSFYYCFAEVESVVDLIDGEPRITGFRDPHKARADVRSCGPDGKNWKPVVVTPAGEQSLWQRFVGWLR